MNLTRWLAAALLVAGAAAAQEKKDDGKAAREEMKRLQGTWKATGMEMSGKAFTPKQTGMEQVRIKGDQMTFLAGGKEVATFEISVNPDKKPKQMDWVKDKKFAALPCIYELKGDELKICFPLLPGKDTKVKVQIKRPESMETKDRPLGLVVLKREKS